MGEAMTIPDFEGPTFRRGEPNYPFHAYQYATSSYDPNLDGSMDPEAIVYLQRESAGRDIGRALAYAASFDAAIAVRTGGHQYSGASSTSGRNIQLDLSEAFFDFDLTSRPGYLVAGVSHKLSDFSNLLIAHHIFLPMGQCSNVHLGGHVQTGGYGQMCRSFGLLSDNVAGFEMWTADNPAQNPRIVLRDNPADRDLFFAVLGGSPGNFGIVTRVYLNLLHDSDHPNARGLKIVAPFEVGVLEKLYGLMVDFVQTNDLGFDFCVTSAAAPVQYLRDVLGDESYDAYIRLNYPEEYGRDPSDPRSDPSTLAFPTILVFVQFSNLGGATERYDPTFCNKIKTAMAPHGLILHDDGTPSVPSQLNSLWIFPGVREFDFPYIKNAQVTLQTTFPGWAAFAANWINFMQQQQPKGIMVFTQCQYFGGYNSAMYKNRNNGTAFSWRETTIGFNVDLFCASSGARELAARYQTTYTNQAIGPNGIFSKQDLRWYWASHGSRDLSKVWQTYLTPAAHDRLIQIKRHYDPRKVFSPNAFCVDGAKLPADLAGEPVATDAGVVDDKVNAAKLRAATQAGRKRSEL
jgi:hypothetical protein